MAGLALLNKHEQAMKRYEGKATNVEKFAKIQIKQQARSPS